MSVSGEILGYDVNGLPLRKGDKAFFVEQPPLATAESKPIERPVTITGAPGTNSVKRASLSALADGQVEVDVADFDGDYMTCPPGKLRKAQIEATPEEDEEWQAMEERQKRSKYHVQIRPGVYVDVYDVLHAFGVTNPGDQHAIKKMLMPGKRGHKDAIQDRREAIQSLERAIELEARQ